MVIKHLNGKKILILLSVVCLLFNLTPIKIQAAKPDWAAEKYSDISQINLAPGETKKIKIGFYNRGAYNWRNNGKQFVSIYTFNPKYRVSKFMAPSWISASQVTKLKDSLAGPNSKGYFEFELKAPNKPGVYKEAFALAAENKAWIQGGQFTLNITVGENLEMSDEKGNIEEETAQNALLISPKIEFNKSDFSAMKLSRLDPLILNSGEEKNAYVLFLNKGIQTWEKRTLILNKTSLANTISQESFATSAWIDNQTITTFSLNPIKTGQTEIYTIPLKAPEHGGIYTLHFSILVNDKKIEGGSFEIPITVKNPFFPEEQNAFLADNTLNDPRIRIGLFTTEKLMEFISPFEYFLKDSEGWEWSRVLPETKVLIGYNEKTQKYEAWQENKKIISDLPLRLEPIKEDSYFTIINHEILANWGNKINYNEFRDTLEIRLAKTNYTWVINELGMENYLKGMAEDSETSPPEFLKAMAVAERSYAYYHLNKPTKHQAGGFILDANYDQVYRGYAREKISPNAVAAVEATRGIIATYNNEPAFTPYFARSNGKTKSAKAVWGTDIPWLQPVITPYDKGQTQWGHGVGMSARDGLYRAKDGSLWDDILKYYYTGIDLQKIY